MLASRPAVRGSCAPATALRTRSSSCRTAASGGFRGQPCLAPCGHRSTSAASLQARGLDDARVASTGHDASESLAARSSLPSLARIVVPSFALAMGMFALHAALVPGAALASLGEKVAAKMSSTLPPWAIVMAIAALPGVELRGSIPVGIALFKMQPVVVAALSIIGNMLPIPIILACFSNLVESFASKDENNPNLVDKTVARVRKVSADWGAGGKRFWALSVFVGIPLPGTGAWTGAMAASLLAMPFAEGFLANLVGVLMAAAVVTSLMVLGAWGLLLAAVLYIGVPLLNMGKGRKEQPPTQA